MWVLSLVRDILEHKKENSHIKLTAKEIEAKKSPNPNCFLNRQLCAQIGMAPTPIDTPSHWGNTPKMIALNHV